jgi:hypothetical protein
MAVTYTSQASSDSMLYSTVLATAAMLAAIEDRTVIWAHPAIVNADEVMPPGWWVGATPGATFTIPVDMVLPVFSAVGETDDVSGATTIDLGTAKTFTTGSYDQSWGVSNELRRRDPNGRYQVVRIASDIFRAANYTITSLIVALAGSASTTHGADGDPLVWDTIQEAADSIMAAGKSEAGGTLVCVLHPLQWAAVKRDLAASGGARAERREFDQFQAAVSVGYQGMIDNIEIWTSDRVGVSSGTYSGIMFARGGVLVAIVPPAEPAPDQTVVLQTPVAQVTAAYDPDDKSVRLIGDMTCGVSILRQELFRRIKGTA